jgi:hypothetical protein
MISIHFCNDQGKSDGNSQQIALKLHWLLEETYSHCSYLIIDLFLNYC